MAVKAGELYVELTLNGEKYTTELKKAAAETKTLDTETANLATSIFVAEQAYGFAKQALTVYTDAMISQYAEVKQFNAMTGMSIEQGGKWQDMMENLGLSLGDLTMAFRILSNNIQQAVGDEGSGASKAFKQLGVSLVDVNGNMRDSQAIMIDTIDSLQKIPAGYERNALAMDTLGRSYMSLNKLLNSNISATDLLGESTSNVTEDGMKKYDAWKVSMDKFNNTLGDTKAEIGEGLLPVFTNLLDLLNNYVLPTINAIGDRLMYMGYVVAGLGSVAAGKSQFSDIMNYESFAKSFLTNKPTSGVIPSPQPAPTGKATTKEEKLKKSLDQEIQIAMESLAAYAVSEKTKAELDASYAINKEELERRSAEITKMLGVSTNKELKKLWFDLVATMRDNPAKAVLDIQAFITASAVNNPAGAGGIPTNSWTGQQMGAPGSQMYLFMKWVRDNTDKTYQEALNVWGSGGGGAYSTLMNSGWYSGATPVGMASGGLATAGSPYIVGERGPEMFVPNTSGNIISNGSVIHVHVDVDGNEIGNAMVDLIRLRTGVKI